MDIKQIVLNSLTKAMAHHDEGGIPRLIHRNRSKNFVEELASHFREQYRGRESVFVLSKHFDKYREKFGLNELLFDVLVCDTGVVPSALENQNLTFVLRAIWQIESEFAQDSREAMYDFNKLVLGSSEHKLFVGPQTADEGKYLQPLSESAKYCDSNTYVALVPHPSAWKKVQPSVRCWKFEGDWKAI